MTVSPRSSIRKVVSVDQIHDNTSQEVISITTDKLRLALIYHLACVEKQDSWHMPLSFLVVIIVVFCSSTFKVAFGLSADTWQALFLMFGLICVFWLVRNLIRLRKSPTLEELIQIIKNKQE